MPVAIAAVPVIMTAATTAITGFTLFSGVAMVGAVMGVVGAATGSKELQIAGTVLGAVGAVGGLASSAGLFGSAGEAAGVAGGAVDEAGFAMAFNEPAAGTASQAVTPLAGAEGAGSAAAEGLTASTTNLPGVAPVDPGTAVAPDLPAPAPSAAGSTDFPDIISEITGQGLVPEAAPPDVTAAAPPDVLPGAAPDTPLGIGFDQAPAATFDVTDPGTALQPTDIDPTKGLIDQPMVSNQPVDQYGQLISQGGGEGGTLGNMNNPAADAAPQNVTGEVTVPGATAGTAVPGAKDAGVAIPDPGAARSPLQGNISSDALIYGANKGSITQVDNSIWGKITGFVEKNPMVLLGGLAASSSFLSGAFSQLTPAQAAALNAQAEQNLAAANLNRTQNEIQQRRLNNMRQPMPVARRTGLIDMAAVTGYPA